MRPTYGQILKRDCGASDRSVLHVLTFGASVACDTRAFADEILVASFVVGVNDRGHTVEGPFQRVPAQALMTFSDDAVDAPVRTVSDTVNDLG